MKIAKLDGSNIGEIADHKSLFPNTSFPKAGPDSDWLAANDCAEVVVFQAYDSATQKNEGVTPYLSNGKVYTRRVTDMTDEEKAAVYMVSPKFKTVSEKFSPALGAGQFCGAIPRTGRTM